ncbi:hypothetical protein I79_013665 [Cricetulus griseus]|uniref:Uncharacterized protein n=1 Tax=Cricetulus griseus TaxID=10029 RepID=G3HS39_CRIGR|nr:hypothetical protein I79_013665 [Cricetulus griseus]
MPKGLRTFLPLLCRPSEVPLRVHPIPWIPGLSQGLVLSVFQLCFFFKNLK